jgi:hypothetical protein
MKKTHAREKTKFLNKIIEKIYLIRKRKKTQAREKTNCLNKIIVNNYLIKKRKKTQVREKPTLKKKLETIILLKNKEKELVHSLSTTIFFIDGWPCTPWSMSYHGVFCPFFTFYHPMMIKCKA